MNGILILVLVILNQRLSTFVIYTIPKMKRWNKSDKKTEPNNFVDRKIKWTDDLESHLVRNSQFNFNIEQIRKSAYRPFVQQFTYYDKVMIDRIYQQSSIFPLDHPKLENIVINMSGISSSKPFSVLATNCLTGLDFLEKTQSVSQYLYTETGEQLINVTEWSMVEFRKQYKDKKISKEDIFHYVYGVLHNPAYRVKYEQNLKRSLPRIPYYEDFGLWVKWGKALMDLHLNYETVEPYPLEHETHENKKENLGDSASLHLCVEKTLTKAKLKADKENGIIYLDDATTLRNIPPEAWQYKLGNRSALEWILDQYKEKKPKDPTIAKLFNTYRFADYKDKVIDLLMRVTTVSVETMKIIREMEKIN